MVVHRLYLTKLSNTRPRKVVWCWLLYGVDLCLSSGPRFGIWILFCVSKCQNVKGQRNVNFQLLQITIISICYWKMPRYCSLYFFSQSFAKMNSCDTLEAVQFVHNICIVHVILYLSMLFCICMYCTLTNICGSTQGVTCLSPWRVSGRFLRNHLKQDLGQYSKFFLFDTFYHGIGWFLVRPQPSCLLLCCGGC